MGNCCIVKQWDHLYYDLAKVPHQDILYREGHVRGQFTMRRNSWRNRSSKTLRTSYGIAVTREILQVGDKKGSILCVPWSLDEDRLVQLKMNVSVQEDCLYVTWKQDGKMQELWLDVDNPKELVQLIQHKMEQAQGGCSLGRSDGSKSTRRNSLSSHSTRSSHTVSSHTVSSLSAKSSHHMIPEATIKSRRNSLSKSTHNKSSHTRSSHTRSSRRNSSSTHSSKSTLTDKSRRRATM